MSVAAEVQGDGQEDQEVRHVLDLGLGPGFALSVLSDEHGAGVDIDRRDRRPGQGSSALGGDAGGIQFERAVSRLPPLPDCVPRLLGLGAADGLGYQGHPGREVGGEGVRDPDLGATGRHEGGGVVGRCSHMPTQVTDRLRDCRLVMDRLVPCDREQLPGAPVHEQTILEEVQALAVRFRGEQRAVVQDTHA